MVRTNKWRRKIQAAMRRWHVTYVPPVVESIADALGHGAEEFGLKVHETACGKSVEDWRVTLHNDGTVSMCIMWAGGVVMTQRRILVDTWGMARDIVRAVERACVCDECGMFTFDHCTTAKVPFC